VFERGTVRIKQVGPGGFSSVRTTTLVEEYKQNSFSSRVQLKESSRYKKNEEKSVEARASGIGHRPWKPGGLKEDQPPKSED
jgi:hypothetical protein